MISTWSFSALTEYERCPYRSYLAKVKKEFVKISHPAIERGNRIHKYAEEYIKGQRDKLPKDLQKFPVEFQKLRDAYSDDKAFVEAEWGFEKLGPLWNPCGWQSEEVWLRVKADVVVLEDDTSIRIIDFKTGRKFGNELKHNSQTMLYGCAAFNYFPNIEHVNAEIWYLDEGSILQKPYSRNMAKIFQKKWHDRAEIMTEDFEFIPNPSKSNCKYCPYRETQKCDYAVEI